MSFATLALVYILAMSRSLLTIYILASTLGEKNFWCVQNKLENHCKDAILTNIRANQMMIVAVTMCLYNYIQENSTIDRFYQVCQERRLRP